MTYMIETKNLTKKIRKQIIAEKLSLKVPESCVYGLLGANGAGKSTTLKMIAGILAPTSGEILIEGEPLSRRHMQKMGILIENPALYGNLTAKENLLIHEKLLGVPPARKEEVLEIVDLKNTGKKKTANFSVGMKQRLGIAVALMSSPKLLLLDEPTSGLDPIGIQELRGLIRSFAESGITVVLSSHDLSEVQQVADFIGIIDQGRLGYQGKLERKTNLEELFMEIVQKGGARHAHVA